MTPAARLTHTRRLLDTPPPAAVPGQTTIPDAALAVMTAAEDDAHPDDTPQQRAHHIARELTRHGWTITPTT